MEQQVRFCTTSDGVRIAYAVLGEGPPLVSVPGWISHLELDWQIPQVRTGLEELAQHFTLVRLDKRGTGLSDRGVGDYSLEARVRDLEAVVDQLKLRSFFLSGISEGGPTCLTYAALHPKRVLAMVLYGTFAHGGGQFGGGPGLVEGLKAVVKAEWGLGSRLLTDMFVGEEAPPGVADFFTAYQRAGATAEDAYALLEATLAIDVRSVLRKVKTPTLIIHARGDRIVPIDLGREIAAGVPGARFLSVDGSHITGLFDEQRREATVAFLLEHAGAARRSSEATAPAGGRPSVTILLFTDMEGSTTLTQRLGDAQAQELVRAHNAIVREALRAHEGSEIKHTGDGIMAAFSSAIGALECAIAMQRAFAERNEGSSDLRFRVRIGVNAGEPVAEEADLFGTAVQLARRICDQAEPEQILASDVVRGLASGKGFLFADTGDVVLKGFEEPVRLFELRWKD